MSANPAVWANLGTTFEQPTTASKAVVAAGLDYKVKKQPILTMLDGINVSIPQKMALVREQMQGDPHPRFLGFAGPRYAIIQNREIAGMLDQVTHLYPVSMAGHINHGQTMFLFLDAGIVQVRNINLHGYYLFLDTKNGGSSMKIRYVPVRVDDGTTLLTDLKTASVSMTIGHRATSKKDLGFRLAMLEQMRGAQQRVHALFESLMTGILLPSEAERILTQVYPAPTKPARVRFLEELDHQKVTPAQEEMVAGLVAARDKYEYYTARAEELRRIAWQAYCAAEEFPNTIWALFLEVCRLADNREGNSERSVSQSAIWGTRANEKLEVLAGYREILAARK